MTRSPNLDLPYLVAEQALKHITHNEALQIIDALAQAAVLDKDLNAPPDTPSEGDSYVVGAGAVAAWQGRDAMIASFRNGAWTFHAPRTGWSVWVVDEKAPYVFDGSAWAMVFASLPLVGVNTGADATNRLAVKSDAVLFSHDDVTPGNGSLQLKLNKAHVAATASALFQTGWSGRAEFGLCGDDDWHVKVSANGQDWAESLVADATTGAIRFPSGIAHPNSRQRLSSFLPTPGGDGAVSIFRSDTPRPALPHAAMLASVSGDLLTLTSADAGLFFADVFMAGVSLVRIWNTSKSPAESAWVSASPATNQLRVHDAGAVMAWSAGETVEIGETGSDGSTYVPIDISPMMQNLFGTVFRQTGAVLKCGVGGTTGQAKIWAGDSIAPGAAVPIFSDHDGAFNNGMLTIPCSQVSPVSHSNLIWLTDWAADQLSTTLLSVKFLIVE